MDKTLRKSGLEMIGDVPWGTHFCQFYKTAGDLLEVLVPYFKTGLENNEFCMWVVAEPVGKELAKNELRKAVPDLDERIKKGQLEIISHLDWYLLGGKFESQRVLKGWVDKFESARTKGYDGLRLTGNTFWLEKEDWNDFNEYEQEVTRVLGNYEIIAFCTYSLEKCSIEEIIDVVSSHQFAIIRRGGKWNLIESTDLKQVKEALEESEKKFKIMVETAQEGIKVIDENADITFVNKKHAEMLGYTVDELLGKNLFDLMDTDAVKEAREHFEKRKKGISEQFEFRFKHKNGGDIWTLVSSNPLFDPRGAFKGSFGMYVDITEKKKAEDYIRQLNVELQSKVDQLEAANKELDSFSYSISHDLRVPLRALDGFSKILIEDHLSELTPEGQRYLKMISENSNQMAHLIDDLLAFSRLGRQALNKTLIDTKTLIKNALNELKDEQKGRHVEFSVGELPPCHADPALLKQVFLNLLSNAIKFTRKREIANIIVGSTLKDGKVAYYVKDNGVGFEMEYAGKLFGVFQRFHRVEEYEGTGVGLAIVRRIIHQHGGEVWAEAEADKGAAFFFTLGGEDDREH